MGGHLERAAELQQLNRESEHKKLYTGVGDLSAEAVAQATIYTREDVTMLVSLSNDAVAALTTIKRLMWALVILALCGLLVRS